ncbi:Multifunctional methyltransferase subunit TRM112-like protein [Caenorhabditis elegans]|uniref:Multifunctional methyltransferase subunit TRM112-like protein n=1 Tax=Caenorhabditis elegans TaxID=6239 RepID=TR112_CAEEL|nr:Multifunctional methyltransferase subunit TRM112-like protein [Caenorhabditis elegans]O45241.1 RecName: Full=Multifunctional methyltransferase subunit TRM112-like protein; AltName: Full=tRNA methyltransferase 112 homolog [Caenorhabditis elegans]CAB03840.1 Multifunctional methyltransferase subunit TRM112-like protein [Caenorhabditis elegans]|eukprot:NP_497021.1 Multifunctional methyltransferase subunit TRM112-like protein [Caenorhabditis elegans]
MKLFVHNFMSSRFLKNVTVGYPLNLVVKQFVEKDIEFDRDNTIVMLDRIQYEALIVAAAAVNQSDRIPREKPEKWDELTDEQLRVFHHLLMNIDVIDGELICPETKTVFPIRDGIPNMLKVDAEK